jgi:hypothetical protein
MSRAIMSGMNIAKKLPLHLAVSTTVVNTLKDKDIFTVMAFSPKPA